jgi:hypothetical protein
MENPVIGIYISDEVSETAGGIVIYIIHQDGERVRGEIAPDMVNAYKVPILN